jgi:hypothetical protein
LKAWCLCVRVACTQVVSDSTSLPQESSVQSGRGRTSVAVPAGRELDRHLALQLGQDHDQVLWRRERWSSADCAAHRRRQTTIK